MFQLLALNPPARAGRSKHRGGKKRRTNKKRVGVKRSSRRRAKRSNPVPHRTPPRIKSGPRRGQFRKRAGKRRNPTGHVFSGKFYRPKLRRRPKRRKWAARAFRKVPVQRERLGIARAYFNNPGKKRKRKSKRRYGRSRGRRVVRGSKSRAALARYMREHRAASASRRRSRKARAEHADIYGYNPRRKRRRRRSKSRRHHNPRRRRHSNKARRHKRRRHRNPSRSRGFSIMGPKFRIPGLGWEIAPVEIVFEGVGIAAGAAAAILIPQKVVSLIGKPAWNQGWYGVGLSALTTVGLASVGRLASAKVAKLLGLGGAFATVLRAAAQLVPSQTQQWVSAPLASAAGGGGMVMSPQVAAAIAAASGGSSQQRGMGGFLTAQDIIAGEQGGWNARVAGLRDWVGSGQGMRDWVDPQSKAMILDDGAEPF